jgi:chemotaxis protein MotB
MNDSQNIIPELRKSLFEIEKKIEELRVFQENTESQLQMEIEKPLKVLSLLQNKVAKSENELAKLKKSNFKEEDKLYQNLKEKYKKKTENLMIKEISFKKELEENQKRLEEIKSNKNKISDIDSEKLDNLKSIVNKLKLENLKYQSLFNKETVIKEQLKDELSFYDTNEDYETRIPNKELINEYAEMVDVTNKVVEGFYETSPIIQSMKFYSDLIKSKKDNLPIVELCENQVIDTNQKIKKYEREYHLKLKETSDDSADLALRNKELEINVQQKRNDFETEASKNSMNSGEFVGGGDFFVSFSDVMSVLLCFFVVFFAISDHDAEKFDEFFASWPNRKDVKINVKRPNNASLNKQELALLDKVKALVEENVDPNIITRNDVYEINLTFKNSELFGKGEAILSSSGINLLKKKIEDELKVGGIKQIRIADYTSDKELKDIQMIKTRFRNDLFISSARAGAVSKFISKNYKFPAKFIIVTGYGSYKPTSAKLPLSSRDLRGSLLLKILKDKSIRKISNSK